MGLDDRFIHDERGRIGLRLVNLPGNGAWHPLYLRP